MSRTHGSTIFYLLILLVMLASLPKSAQAGRAAYRAAGELPPPPEKPAAAMYDAWHRPLKVERLSPLSDPQVDHFGYTLDDTHAIDWKDATAGTEVIYQDKDDGHSGEIPIGFGFEFYEKVYTSLFVNTNGFVTFGNGSDAFSNRYLPHDTPPNNLLAAYWDDLYIAGGGVYYLLTDCAGGPFFVIE